MDDEGVEVARSGASSQQGGSDLDPSRWFVSDYDHSMDEKGRLVLPAAFRGRFGPGTKAWVRHVDRIELHTAAVWDEFATGVTEARAAGRLTVAQLTEIFTNAADIRIDNAGRFLIPEKLRERARVGRDVQICGIGRIVIIRNRPADVYDGSGLADASAALDGLGF